LKSIGKAVKRLISFDEASLIMALLVIVIVLSLISPFFLTTRNIMNVLRQSSITLIAGIGMTIVLLLGEVDLSIGSLSAFVAIFTVRTLNFTGSIVAAALVAIAIGILAGLLNAFIVTRFEINSLIVTLGMLSVYRGIGYIITDAIAVQNNVPSFTVLGTGHLGTIPIPVLVAFIVFGVFYFILNYTTLGRYIYATGGNEKAAIASGINVKKIKTIGFVTCSTLAALSALILTSRVNSGQPNLGEGFEFIVIAATILGGTSLNGGQGSLIGTLTGILILGVLENGMILMDVSSFYQKVVSGAVIIVAVIIDKKRMARRERVRKVDAVSIPSTNEISK
jgi:ribose transport system permease protein